MEKVNIPVSSEDRCCSHSRRTKGRCLEREASLCSAEGLLDKYPPPPLQCFDETIFAFLHP